MKYIHTFLLVIFCQSIFSQTFDLNDSIRGLIQNYQYQAAINKIDKKLAVKTDNNLLVYKGLALKGLLKYADAIKIFEIVLLSDTCNYQSTIELATIYKILGDYRKSLTYLSLAKKIYSNPFVEMEMAAAYYATEEFVKAKNLYQIIERRDSSNLFVVRNIAKCYDNLENNDSAVVYFNKALLINSLDYQSVSRLCNIFIATKDYQKGIETTEEFIKLDSTNTLINRTCAYLYFLNGKYNTAVEKFVKCYQANDTSDFVCKNLGISYFKIDNYDTAKIFLKKAAETDKKSAQVYYFLGMSCCASNEAKDGIGFINKAIELLNPSPEYMSGVYQNLAKAYNDYFEYQLCLNSLFKAREYNPKDTILLYKIGLQYDNWLKQKDTALVYYKYFMTTRPPKTEKKEEEKSVGIEISYYDIVSERIIEIEKELAKKKKK